MILLYVRSVPKHLHVPVPIGPTAINVCVPEMIDSLVS